MTGNLEQNIEIPKEFVMQQKIGIRDLFRVSKCSKGLHVWIPPKIIAAWCLEAGDQLLIRIEEVRYDNLREVPVI